MQRLLLSLDTPAENLALDEALLEWAEEENADWEFLRLWESSAPLVVVGRASRVDEEVDTAACAEGGVPILRRSSGGAAIVAGPGCLMYAVVLSYRLRPELRDIRRAHCFVLSTIADALRPLPLGGRVELAGTSDLVLRRDEHAGASVALALQKFSGNSLRAKRTHLLYHGTLLYDFHLPLVAQCLRMPSRQPDYRQRRPHDEFVTNLPATREALVERLIAAWPCQGDLSEWPESRVAALVAERFSRDDWNLAYGRPGHARAAERRS